MTWALITDIENIPTEIKTWLSTSPVVHTAETDAENVATAGWNYIKTNGLTAAYSIALTLLKGAATDTPWGTLEASLVSAIESAGISLVKGAESVILGQAQADLIAVGQLVSPATGATLAANTPAA